jgi:hypothetical protein
LPGEDGDPFESKASDSPARRYRLPMTYVTTVRLFLRCRLSFNVLVKNVRREQLCN